MDTRTRTSRGIYVSGSIRLAYRTKGACVCEGHVTQADLAGRPASRGLDPLGVYDGEVSVKLLDFFVGGDAARIM